ncbi:MAG: hypothetical protein IJM63_00240 [Solobacterium sp.]|nr:hypothetical protein [Solobacterium sp.]
MKFKDYVSDRTDIAREEGREEGIEKSIAASFTMLRSMGKEEETAISLLSENFKKTPEEIREILRNQQAEE